METTSTFIENVLETLEVSSSTSSTIHVAWQVHAGAAPFVESYQVHYQKLESTYVQYGPRLSPVQNTYEIQNLVADTYYKVCLVVKRNNSLPMGECMGASTTNWHLPVSIGSSIGAILALVLIVFIVLLSRCQIPVNYRHKKRKHSSHYNNMSSTFHDDHYDFSETNTHANDEEYASVFDHDDDTKFDIVVHEGSKEPAPRCPGSAVPLRLTQGHVHPLCSPSRQHDSNIRVPLSRMAKVRQFTRANSLQCDGPICSTKHQKLKERRSSLAYQCGPDESPQDDSNPAHTHMHKPSSLLYQGSQESTCQYLLETHSDEIFPIKSLSSYTHKKKAQSQGFSFTSTQVSNPRSTTVDKLLDTGDTSCVFPPSCDPLNESKVPMLYSKELAPIKSTQTPRETKDLPCLLSEDIRFDEFTGFHGSSDAPIVVAKIAGPESGAKPKQPKQMKLKPKHRGPPLEVISGKMYEEDSL